MINISIKQFILKTSIQIKEKDYWTTNLQVRLTRTKLPQMLTLGHVSSVYIEILITNSEYCLL